jgi:hypothetical protein
MLVARFRRRCFYLGAKHFPSPHYAPHISALRIARCDTVSLAPNERQVRGRKPLIIHSLQTVDNKNQIEGFALSPEHKLVGVIMSLKSYYERQAQTNRRLATHAITADQAHKLLTAANYYDTRAHELEQIERQATPWPSSVGARNDPADPATSA